MRLEEGEDASFVRTQRAQGRRALFGIVAEIVDHSDAAGRHADQLETARKPVETGQRLDGGGHGNARCRSACDGGESIRQIMAAGQIQA